MIRFVKGDLLQSEAQALVNTVNTVGVMGKGIALQFREAFPDNYNIYRKACKEKKLKTGDLLITEEQNIFGNNKIIINFPTKTHWKLPSEYAYIVSGLKSLKKAISHRNIKSVAIPPLGSHNGGLDWQIVRKIIIEELKDLDCEILLYEPNQAIADKMKEERVKLTPARAMLIILLADLCRFGEFPSTFAAEKIVYFLQKFGAKEYFKINFKPYLYGPYSEGKIAHVLYHLNGSYIMGMTAMDNKPFEYFSLTDDAERDAKSFLDCYNSPEIYHICKQTMTFLHPFYSNLSLEVLSTTDFILENTPNLQDWRQQDSNSLLFSVVSEIEKMSSRKKNLLKPEFVSKAISHLKTLQPSNPQTL